MKIGFDARMIRHSGIGTYIRNLLRHLTARENLDFTLFGSLEKIADYPARKVSASWPIYSLREQIYFPSLLRRELIRTLHVPHYNAPLAYRGTLVVNIHDLIHLLFPPSRTAYLYARTVLEIVSKKASAILTISENTKRDILRLLKVKENKIHVIYPGVNLDGIKGTPYLIPDGIKRPEDMSHGIKYGVPLIPSPYILYVGNIKPTKNVICLLEAFTLLESRIQDLKLVVAGRDFMPNRTESFRSNPNILFLGELSERALTQLYQGAKLFVFPSLYEGFGLPPLEAMACGVPVLCSHAASLPEAAGDAAEFFDPNSSNDLAEKIAFLWENENKRKQLVQKGYENIRRFSWEKCARETEKIYASL
ncbi:MAG: glycosyltransferase family 4 protein [Elusimicrobia bacterium]|nr:glycosyltransferase family 4 protein [Elusimicrobiota bacterium]